MALVRMSAQMIENRLFNVHFTREITLHFHTRPEFIGTLWEGIAVFSQEGRLLAVNRSGAFQLGVEKQLGVAFEQLFGVPFASFLDAARKEPRAQLQLQNGIRLHARALLGQHIPLINRVSRADSQPSVTDQPLDQLDTGDALMHNIVCKAKLALGHDIPILIEGETGTGKELLAHAIHAASRRAARPLVSVNIAAVPETLLEAEFFGVAPGAYTGADRKGRDGKFKLADGGTLFLDEIGDMPPALQAKLLRVLQEQELEPLGSNEVMKVDVRVIAATSRDLAAMVRRGEFRADLFYRLNVLPIRLPALRERSEDIGTLVDALLGDIARRSGLAPKTLSAAALKVLEGKTWPGNVRELRNALEQAFLMSDDDELLPRHFGRHESAITPTGTTSTMTTAAGAGAGAAVAVAAAAASIESITTSDSDVAGAGAPPSDLPSMRRSGSEEGYRPPQRVLGATATATLPARKAELERAAIAQALKSTNGNRVAAARLLAISRATLYERLAKYPELASA